MNRAQILGSIVSRKSATLGRGSSTSSDWKIYIRTKEGLDCLRDGQMRRAHLKSNVLVLLENPSGVFEDLVHIFLSQLLKVCDGRLEFFAHVALVLAETEGRLEPPACGRCQKTHCCNKSKAFACIFFPLYRNINSENFYEEQKKKRQGRNPHRAERGSPRTSRSLKRASTSDTSHQFSIRHSDPSKPGIVSRYDLNNAVYTTCANRIS